MSRPTHHPMQSRMSRPFLVACVVVGFVLVLALPAGAATPVLSDSARGDRARVVANEVLGLLVDKEGPRDSQWYASGAWHLQNPTCWSCDVGPATLAATLWRVNGRPDPTRFNEAVATFDRVLATRRNATGSFGDPRFPDTQFFGIDLSTAYLLLGTRLGPHHRKAWRAAIAGAADYLIRHKELTWVANGNICLGNTVMEWLAWAITGKQRFRDAYELSWKYTIRPPQSRWPGYGLHLTRAPSGAKGDVGAGYLAENGGSGPGFDPEYTAAQLSVASRAFLLSGDPRFRWLSNVLWNQISPRVNRHTWTFDARGGTRHSNVDMLTTPAIAVLATAGHRADLRQSVDAQTQIAMYTTYLGNARQNWGNESLYRGYASDLSVALLALASPPAKGSRTATALEGTSAPSETRHVTALPTRSGVRLTWRAIPAGEPHGGPVDLLVDGRFVKLVNGPKTFLHLAPGLHQISIAANGLRPGLSTIVTIPA
jgi:hypothetical protein